MKPVSFSLTGRPISKKNSKRIFRRGGRMTFLPSAAYCRFENDCLDQIMLLRAAKEIPKEPITCKVKISTTFSIKGKFDMDGDNAHTGILDILQKAGIIANDSQVQFGQYVKFGGHRDWKTTVEITDLEEGINGR